MGRTTNVTDSTAIPILNMLLVAKVADKDALPLPVAGGVATASLCSGHISRHIGESCMQALAIGIARQPDRFVLTESGEGIVHVVRDARVDITPAPGYAVVWQGLLMVTMRPDAEAKPGAGNVAIRARLSVRSLMDGDAPAAIVDGIEGIKASLWEWINAMSETILSQLFAAKSIRQVAEGEESDKKEALHVRKMILQVPARLLAELESACQRAAHPLAMMAQQDKQLTIFDEEARFPDGMRLAVQVCLPNQASEEACWTQGVLFTPDGTEVDCTNVGETLAGEYTLSHGGKDYTVVVMEGADAAS